MQKQQESIVSAWLDFEEAVGTPDYATAAYNSRVQDA